MASNFLVTTVYAAGLGLPDVGAILQQVQPQLLPAFSSNGPRLMIEKSDGKTSRLLSNETLLLQKIRISNNTIFETPTLLALVEDAQGEKQTLSQLVKLASRITDFYRSHGYPLARTIIPAQTIEEGVVLFQVIEPRYGKITLDNRSEIRDSLLHATLASVKVGQFIEESALDHALLLLSDIAGVVVNPALKPGSENGTSDLLISTTSGPAVMGSVGLDNHGNKYTGQLNVAGALTLINPFHHGDKFDLNMLSAGPGMNFQSAAYESLFGGQGTYLGGSFSSMRYAFKTSYPTGAQSSMVFLAGSGNAKVTSLWLKQNLMRSREKNVYALLNVEKTALQDRLDAGESQNYKDRHTEMMNATFFGDFLDPLFLGGNTSWNLRSTFGRLIFEDEKVGASDANTANTSGSFLKLSSNLTHIRDLGNRRELLINFKTQWANRNLDASQKMGAGGPYSVRAYASGAVSGDQGGFVSAELRQFVGSAWGSQWTASAFMDSATLLVNKNTWTDGENSATLTGAGVGLSWFGPSHFSGSAYFAAPIGIQSSLVGDPRSVQFSLVIQKQF